jgi:hypothetical protein
MRLQRIDAAGVMLWGTDGVLAGSTDVNYLLAALISDGQGGFIVAYQSHAQYGNWLQRVDANGSRLWSTNGVLVAPTPESETPTIASDGAGGAIMVWSDFRNGSPFKIGGDLFAQRVDGSGAIMWDPDGEPVAVAAYYQNEPVSIRDNDGGLMVAWLDSRAGYYTRVWGQRIAADGTMLWAPNGIALSLPSSPSDSDQDHLRMVPGVGGDAIVVWRDNDPYTGYSIFAQRVDPSGTVHWGQEGMRVYDGVNYTLPWGVGAPTVAAQDRYAVVVVTDRQFADSDVFAQRIDLVTGQWGAPEPNFVTITDNPADQGGQVVVAWNASQLDMRPQRTITHYSVWRSPLGASSWQAVGVSPARYSAFYSLLVPTPADSSADDPAIFEWMVRSHSVDSLTWTSPVVVGYSVDDMAPEAPSGLAAKRQGFDVVLGWSAPGSDDVVEYRIYRAASPDMDSSTLAGVASSTSFVDADAPPTSIYYAVVAVDRAGNASALSSEVNVPGEPSPGDGTATPRHLALLPNVPNPFSAGTRLRIGIPRAGDVSLEVFDVAGRRVAGRRIVGLRSGWQAVTFDGRSDDGRILPSGIYFVRASAGGESVTRKILIAR